MRKGKRTQLLKSIPSRRKTAESPANTGHHSHLRLTSHCQGLALDALVAHEKREQRAAESEGDTDQENVSEGLGVGLLDPGLNVNGLVSDSLDTLTNNVVGVRSILCQCNG